MCDLSLNVQLSETNTLLKAVSAIPDKKGGAKLRRKIEAELRFLKRVTKEEQLRSTNLPYLAALFNCSMTVEDLVEVLKPFPYTNQNNKQQKIVVDIVAGCGETWIKVVARKPQALFMTCLGASGYGKKSIVDQAKELVSAAEQNLWMFKPPRVQLWMASGVTKSLKKILENEGVRVLGEEVDDDTTSFYLLNPQDIFNSELNILTEKDKPSENSESCLPESDASNVVEATKKFEWRVSEKICTSEPTSTDEFINARAKDTNKKSSTEVASERLCLCVSIADETVDNTLSASKLNDLYANTLNLDISTMLAYVSNLTNGRAYYKFQELILTDQAKRERLHPVKPQLDNLFKGRKLVCCKTALEDFQQIVSTVGGENEKNRAAALIKQLHVVSDQTSDKSLSLFGTGRMRQRSQVIFGTGDSIQAVTVTANQGFVRAAKAQIFCKPTSPAHHSIL
ncbi:UPF0415 protein C7orf25 homolog isoform X2 [Limulus polyphemus]|uniref:UPF0415 protein C7orf25 homolog isoform X2 n=1 Tax=Limulus polyphemus TaxID=6850 RepID=A0ABM1S8F8_LIMPO|nr:UPF0415 protein C7orf25 homolog isoform X2 [Limulus polyphemus]